MTAGLVCNFAIWQVRAAADSPVGGAMLTGTFYRDVEARLEELPVTQQFLEQGLVVDKVFELWIRPADLDVQESDQVVMTHPTNHRFYNKRFRVVDVVYPSVHAGDSRGFLQLRCVREVRARSDNAWQ